MSKDKPLPSNLDDIIEIEQMFVDSSQNLLPKSPEEHRHSTVIGESSMKLVYTGGEQPAPVMPNMGGGSINGHPRAGSHNLSDNLGEEGGLLSVMQSNPVFRSSATDNSQASGVHMDED